MKIYSSVEDLIGHTPLMALSRMGADLPAKVLVKLESFNPAGSVKDRAAKSMLDDAEKSGKLQPGGLIIEPTSGNTGIALCALAAARGYRCIIVMPDTMSIERQKLMTAFGAQVVLSPGKLGMAGAIAAAQKLAEDNPGSFIPGQFINPANAEAHFVSTGPEIWADTDGKVDIFVAGVGTGGTLTGTGRYLKSQNPNIRVYAVEPAGSPVISGGKPGSHGIQGIGAGFFPEITDPTVIDGCIPVRDEDAKDCARRFAWREGVLVGISSGAALWAALWLARQAENAGKTIVTLLPDSGERYLSTDLFG